MQIPHAILIQDLFIGSTYLITFILLIIGWGFYKKSARKNTSTFGLAVYLLTFAGYSFLVNSAYLYSEYLEDLILDFSGTALWIAGILILVFSVESDISLIEHNRHIVTAASAVFTVVTLGASTIGLPTYVSFIGLSISIVYVMVNFIDRVMELETARQTFPQLWFGIGIALSGFANFIIAFMYSYEGFLIKNFLVLFGAMCLSYSWRAIPNTEDLDWLLTLDRLLVISKESSLSLLDFKFRKLDGVDNDTESPDKDGMLVAGAISGIDTLIGEILADSGGLDEIEYGSRTVLFDRRKNFTTMLVAERSIRELRYRIESFSLLFENRYGDIVQEYQGNVSDFADADDVVREIFT